MSEVALTESPSLRHAHAGRVEVLDRVKTLALLPDGVHATTELVAGYYEVPVKTVESVVADHRVELAANGYRVLRGRKAQRFARSFKGLTPGATSLEKVANLAGPKPRALALFTRRAVLAVGMVLPDSPVARQVRTCLLDTDDPTPIDESLETAVLRAVREEIDAQHARLRELAEAGACRDAELRALSARIEQAASQVQARWDWFTPLAYARMNGLPTDRYHLERLTLVAGRIAREGGLKPMSLCDANGQVGIYPVAALDEAAALISTPGLTDTP